MGIHVLLQGQIYQLGSADFDLGRTPRIGRLTVGRNIIRTRNVTLTSDFDFGLDHPVPGGYKYRDLVLQVGRVSAEKAIYGSGFCSALTSTWLNCKLQTRPLVREGTLHEEERK
jgi:hypothetical protein